MRKISISKDDLCGAFAVPPLARRVDPKRSLDFAQNKRIAQHISSAGITRLIYGGNAFIYHINLAEYEELLEWLTSLDDALWAIPSIGPSYGRAVDQARLLRSFQFPCVMTLPCGDPRDATGIEAGYREIADVAQTKLILYLKDEITFGTDKDAGLDAVARLVDDGVCIGIKYAVVREDPVQDDYLAGLLQRIDRRFVISGIGERPAIIHLRDWNLPGFTTGSGCIAPRLSQQIFAACERGDFDRAEALRAAFLRLEDLRDAWGPARVLHRAIDQAGIAATGSIPPFISELNDDQVQRLSSVAHELHSADPAIESAAIAPRAAGTRPL